MRVGVVGGGPGGLSFAAFLKARRPSWSVTVWEREWPPRSGFGLVLPGRTLDAMARRDPQLGQSLARQGIEWSRVDIHHRGHTVSAEGSRYRGISRQDLLTALRARCDEVGVVTHQATAPAAVAAGHGGLDLLVAADGASSSLRDRLAGDLGVDIQIGRSWYTWFACRRALDAFAFHLLDTGYGPMVLHSYPFGGGLTAVVVEMRDEVWRLLAGSPPDRPRVGLPTALAEILDAELSPVQLSGPAPRWRRFATVRVRRWSIGNMVLLGDAAHTCHFSIGSGTRLAIEDASTLADCLAEADVAGAVHEYERQRRRAAAMMLSAATASQRWFEELASHLSADPVRLAESLLARGGRAAGHEVRLTSPRPVTSSR